VHYQIIGERDSTRVPSLRSFIMRRVVLFLVALGGLSLLAAPASAADHSPFQLLGTSTAVSTTDAVAQSSATPLTTVAYRPYYGNYYRGGYGYNRGYYGNNYYRPYGTYYRGGYNNYYRGGYGNYYRGGYGHPGYYGRGIGLGFGFY
jgi:hypothetical protein